MPTYAYECENCGEIEIRHSILDDPWQICPTCQGNISRLPSTGGAVIIKGREANQYSDIQQAKFWRDKNGIRHRVTPADGHSKSPTVSQQTVSPEEAEARKRKAREHNKKQRSANSYRKYVQNVVKNKAQ